ncbi:MAG TPA: hypothetical protein PK720_04345 [bacterium]|nr:hypothetical protein [bacterium]
MFNRRWLTQLKKSYHLKNSSRQIIMAACLPLGHEAKKIIFGLQRGEDQKLALAKIKKSFLLLLKKFGRDRLFREGAFRAALEEYIEAVFLETVLNNKNISPLSEVELDADIYLAALSDVSGELVRRTINLISAHNIKEARRLIDAGKTIVDELLEFDMTGGLRTKYDQARNNLRKLEQLNYEISK